MNYTKIICAIGCMLGLAGPLLASDAMVAPQERPMVKVDSRAHYRVAYDIHSGETVAGISKGLFFARGLIEAYQKQGVEPRQLDIHFYVQHGTNHGFSNRMACNPNKR